MKVSVLWSRLTLVSLIEVFYEKHPSSARTYASVRLREVSISWDVRLKRFYCVKFVSGAIERREVEDRCHV